MVHNRNAADDAVRDALAAAQRTEFEQQFRDDRPRDTSGIAPHSIARPGIHVFDGQREVDRLTTWLDALIDSRFGPDEDDVARRPETGDGQEGD